MKEKMYTSLLFRKGFVRMSTMVIILILLVTYYFYQDKIKEISGKVYQNNKENGTIFYATSIWEKMKGVQKSQEERNQNAFDLMGVTKKIKDKSGSFSIEIPQGWSVTFEQGQVGKQLSKIIASNKSFSERNIGSDVFYDNGAQLSIQVLSGDSLGNNHGKMLIEKKSATTNGLNFDYHVITDPKIKTGKIIDAHISREGKTFEIRFVYNLERFNEGEFLFGEIMNSLRFIDKK